MIKRLVGILLISSMCLIMFGTVAFAFGNVGESLPPFTVSTLDGHTVTVNASSEKVTIITFWATWCGPCKGEMPVLNEFYLKYKDQVNYYAVDDEDLGKVSSFMNTNGFVLPAYVAKNQSIYQLLKVQYIPTTIIVDRNGIIQYRRDYPFNKGELEKIVDPLLQ